MESVCFHNLVAEKVAIAVACMVFFANVMFVFIKRCDKDRDQQLLHMGTPEMFVGMVLLLEVHLAKWVLSKS